MNDMKTANTSIAKTIRNLINLKIPQNDTTIFNACISDMILNKIYCCNELISYRPNAHMTWYAPPIFGVVVILGFCTKTVEDNTKVTTRNKTPNNTYIVLFYYSLKKI